MRRWAWLLPLLTVAAIFALRLSGPPDILDKDQGRPIGYILDAAADGNWIVQRDAGGGVSSKPPMYTWLASASSSAFGGNRFALYLPCALGMAALALLAAMGTARRLGWAAGLAAGMALALAIDTQKAITLARTDAVFAAGVAGAAWLALRAWESGRGWLLFWLVCGLVSLTKSPVGVLFAAGGLLAACWPRERPTTLVGATATWRTHALGVGLMLGIAGGWFALAVASLGQPVVDRLIGRELIGHAIANDNRTPWLRTVVLPPWWYFSLFVPWSLLTCAALWRLLRHPPAAPRRRRFLRFMACWLGFGLLVLVLAPHKRMVLALPMLLPGAVLAGSEAGRWLARLSRPRQLTLWAGLASLVLAALAVYHHFGRDPAKDRLDGSQAVIDAGAGLGQLAQGGMAVSWDAGLPASMRYFIAGWPKAATHPAAFLAEPGPGAVAVRTGTQVAGAVRVLPLAVGYEAALDAEAARLLPPSP
jgi:4-amino-4-deoxy-L-arabinose transferase-like glycosyltransferase